MKIEKTPKQKLIDKVYKLLPIYEGKLLDSTEVIAPEKAYNNFQNNINMIVYHVLGIIRITGQKEYLEDVLLTLEGLKSVGLNNHAIVRKSIFTCVKYIERLGDDYGNKIWYYNWYGIGYYTRL